MFSFVRSSFAVLASAALFAGLTTNLAAQTAPQLLPYTVSVVAGGGPAFTFTAGGACPTAGFTATDTFGDGCPATDITLATTGSTSTNPTGPRFAIADSTGAIFFSDATNGIIRRIDPGTGVVARIAGGVTTSPTTGTACGTAVSLDARGDGCLSTAVHLGRPMGLAFAANGDLIFADPVQYDVRRIAATNGFVPATGGTITNVAGAVTGTGTASSGYVVSNASTIINAATQSYLDGVYGVAVDAQGDIIIGEEFKNAILVVNPNATPTTVANVTIPAGAIVKVTGLSTATGYAGTPYCPNATSGTFGCNFGMYTEGANANTSFLDSPYGVAVDSNGNFYLANEFTEEVPQVSAAGTISTYAGIQNTSGKTATRGTAGTFGIGSDFGVAVDSTNNLYVTDAFNGLIWRVDAGTKNMYVVGGGGTPCTAATDTYGDGCPATQATFGKSGASFATAANPGVYGVTVDTYSDLFVGDTITNVIREVSSGTQFGRIGLSGSTQTVAVHFAPGDMEASAAAFTITTGNANFAVGTATCTTNTDSTRDCLVPVTATPTAGTLGRFSGTLRVAATKGGTVSFPLNATAVNTPATRTTVTATPNGAATGCTSTTYSTQTAFTLTATVGSSGTPGGTVTFFDNGTQIGQPQALASNGTASITYTFVTAGNHTVTANYSGDGFYVKSTGTAPTFATAAPGFGFSMDPSLSQFSSTVNQGGTAVYGLTLTQTVYTGTISFSCTGLPAKSTCNFSPTTVSATGCSANSTVTFSIQTTQGTPAGAGILPLGGGRWTVLLMAGLLLTLAGFGVRQRASVSQLGRLMLIVGLLVASSGLMACGSSTKTVSGTPLGTYKNITVTATGSAGGTVATFPITLTVQ